MAFRTAADQVSADIGGEIAILHVASGQYFLLDAVGSRVWRLLEEPRTAHGVINALLGEYDVNRQECEVDVLTLLQGLLDRGLIEVVDDV